MIDRLDLKYRANRAVSETQPSPYVVTFVFLLLSAVVNFLTTKLNDPFYLPSVDFDLNGYLPYLRKSLFPGALLIFALNVLMQAVSVGYLSYALKIARRQPARMEHLGDGFYRFWTVAGIYILEGIFIFLWSLLLIIPGIVASYKYRLAYYLALDRPDLGPLQCISESKRLMNGYKSELFVLDLSFLGWYILGALTFGIVLVWKLPFIHVTYAFFYRQLSDQGSGSGRTNGTHPPFML